MPTTIFTPQMLRNGTRAVPEIPAGGGGGFTNTYSLEFDGIDDRVQMASDLVLSSEFTISFWVKPTSFSGNGNIYPIGTFPGNANYIRLTQIGVLWLRLGGASTIIFNEAVYGSGTNNMVLDTWQHIAFIRDSSNNIRCYRNGADFGYLPTRPTDSNTITFNSFGRIISNTFGFSGALDEIAFWNSDETSNLATIYNSGAPNDLASLSPLAWYRNGDNGSWKSPQWLIPNNENKDKFSNYSLDFDGIDDYITIANNTELNFSSAYSVSFWINTTSVALLSPISNQSKFLIRLYAPANQIRLQLYDGSNSFLNLDNTQVFNDGNWHHIAFTTEATTTADKVIVYFDGVAMTNKGTQANIGSHLSTFAYEIGRNSGTWNFNGGIDEVSLYDFELSASQINDIYNGGEPTTISGAVAHYKMGEEATFSGGVWTVPDAIGSNDGTSNAMTIEDRVGSAPSSSNNSVSFNMDLIDRKEDTPPS